MKAGALPLCKVLGGESILRPCPLKLLAGQRDQAGHFRLPALPWSSASRTEGRLRMAFHLGSIPTWLYWK